MVAKEELPKPTNFIGERNLGFKTVLPSQIKTRVSLKLSNRKVAVKMALRDTTFILPP